MADIIKSFAELRSALIPELYQQIRARDSRIGQLEAELEDTRQAWVDGEDASCEDVCQVACKGPCGGAG